MGLVTNTTVARKRPAAALAANSWAGRPSARDTRSDPVKRSHREPKPAGRRAALDQGGPLAAVLGRGRGTERDSALEDDPDGLCHEARRGGLAGPRQVIP